MSPAAEEIPEPPPAEALQAPDGDVRPPEAKGPDAPPGWTPPEPPPAEAGAETGGPPGPDAMLGLWSSWMRAMSGATPAWSNPSAAWWQGAGDEMAGAFLAGGVRQVNEALARDPVLRAVDKVWNANPLRQVVPVDWAEIARALRTVWLRSLGNPATAMAAAAELNASLWRTAMENWNEASRRWLGTAEAAAPEAKGSDKRFAAPEWQNNPAYRTLKDAYLLASDWLLRQGESGDMDEAERQRLNFHLRQFVDATSPSLMLLSNPAALRRAMETGGASLADGARNLANDLREGRLSMVDATAFAPGRNLALSPGKVVHRSKLIELIQYAPTQESVHKVPLLLLPPWINKFYILDMQPKNSLVKHLNDQGFTVFMVSWKNPDASMDGTTIEDYIDLGVLEASDVVRDITGSAKVNIMGYCIGGTMLAMALSWLAAKGDDRFASATFMVSLQDFSKVGDTAVFVEEPAVDLMEQQMMERGYLDSREMSNMFNLLRSNDLIWANVVNNYLMGEKPPAFDLLYWNSDGTRMARAAHSWYLRNTYRENNLIKPGAIRLKGEAIDLGKITLPLYAVGAEKDHIVPWDAAWRITKLAGGEVRFILASSGHIAGIINPPGGKGTYWTQPAEAPEVATAGEWRRAAERHDGSWWTDWTAWLAQRSGRKGPPPPMGSASHPPLMDAPGDYVMEK
ncbi:class I poly(R)-hydroxyalkanoic acid synthase [Roseomonas sp. OT10]|uniref:PHA/PHB synthase family protein n=1 Tax=Roseomonas cutis TaxID=2897332 RepID=UPI001E377C42|nr:class I poly(R)-hydroxyalkanoic acid synthase [Roseomonas sp. OT10]UFN49793.1 class I poly(R)-hydroxyalkanoic acid synthase [Roseomonas sp. OT10]